MLKPKVLMINLKRHLTSGKLLFLVVVFASVIRIYGINDFPPALNWDEVSHGYNAYSILKTGRDEWGEKLPLIFRAYGDYKLPVYIYTLIPFITVFQLNEFSVRLPSVLAGVGIVVVTYFLVLELFRKKEKKWAGWIALLSAFLVAVEPWSFFLSRGAFEANLSQFFIILGIYLFIRSLNSKTILLPWSIVFLGLSVWTYNSARIFTPLILVSLFVIFGSKLKGIFTINKKVTAFSLLLAAFLFFPMFFQLSQTIGQARFEKVSLVDQGAVGKIIEYRNNSSLPDIVSRSVYNRVTYFGVNFVKNWIDHYSPGFLFFRGGDNYQFSIPGKGILYLMNLPLFYLGLIYLLQNFSKNKGVKLLLLWLILAPIASSATREAPHVLRSVTFIPLPMILSALGFAKLIQVFQVKNLKFIYCGYSLAVLVFLTSYLKSYFNDYPLEYSSSWQYGYKQVAAYVSENHGSYDKIIITKKYGEPHEFLLFYLKYDPKSYFSDEQLIRYERSDWFWVDKFDKFYFVNDWDVPRQEWQPFILESESEEVDCRGIRCLLITSPGNAPKTWSKTSEVKFLNGPTAFEIYVN